MFNQQVSFDFSNFRVIDMYMINKNKNLQCRTFPHVKNRRKKFKHTNEQGII